MSLGQRAWEFNVADKIEHYVVQTMQCASWDGAHARRGGLRGRQGRGGADKPRVYQVGPTQGDLRPGQSITVEENRCFYPADYAFECESGSRSFTIQADDTITASGKLDEPPVWTLPDYF